MSNKKRRKRREEGLLKVSLVKELARNAIGTPPPTKVRQNKRGRTIRTVRPLIAEQDTSSDYIRMTTYVEEETVPNYVHSPISVSVPTPKQWPSTGRTQPGIRFSEEVITHADFLWKTQGEQAASAYLNSIKEGERMSSNVIGGATLETALKDAKEKADFHRRSAATHLGEANKWQQVQEQLENVLKLATSPAKAVTSFSPQNSSPSSKAGKGFWAEAIVMHFKLNPEPITRVNLKNILMAIKPGIGATSVYGPIAKAIELEVLFEDQYGMIGRGNNFPKD